MQSDRNELILKSHPCFNSEAHKKFSRVHMPVAPACNIQCKYCVRKYDCANESRPGVTSRVFAPSEAVDRVRGLVAREQGLSVVGIAGPGDPLFNDNTFDFMRSVKSEFPELTLCLSTNGLLLADRLPELLSAGCGSLTVTINSVTPETADRIYSWITYRGERVSGFEAVEFLVARQWQGVEMAAKAGLLIKINTIYMPGINDLEIPLISRKANSLGAYIMNLMPLIPQGEFSDFTRPTREMLDLMRSQCDPQLHQMRHCMQCRADAFGPIGSDGDMELELVNAAIGEDYCETVC